MSLNLNPWLALLLGIFIGWILEWLLEVWFFRRKRVEDQRRLAEVEAQLRTCDGELRLARARADSLQAELAAKASSASAAITNAAPTVEVETPHAEEGGALGPTALAAAGLAGAAVGAALSGEAEGEVAAVAPEVEALPPEGEVAEVVEAAEIEAVQAEGAEMESEAGWPGAAAAAAALSEEVLPDVELEGARIDGQLPEVDLTAGLPRAEFVETHLPEVDLTLAETAEVSAAAPGAFTVETGATAALPGAALAAGVVGVAAGVLAAGAGEEQPAAEAQGELAAVGAVAVVPQAAVEVQDDLTLIHGIGSKFAGQLAAAGIISFAALAAATPEELRQAVQPPAWQKVDYAAWIAEAKVWVNQAETIGDHLLSIEGIGPVYAAKLRVAGITTFAQLADTDEARLAEIVQAPSWRRVSFSEWRAQARLAAARDQVGLAELQSKLDAGEEKDNLDLIAGVSPKTVAALEAAGITTFAALAAATPEQLDQIASEAGGRSGDYEAWIAEAGLRAAGNRVVRPKAPEPCLQDLSRVEGIGSAYEAKLYAGGIGTYWQLSELADAELAYILSVQDFQKVDLAGIKADALRLAEETDTVGRTWDGTPPDDFDLIEGIGDVYEGRLYDAGICTFEALAAASSERLDEICAAPEFHKPDYAAWIVIAKRFLEKRGRGVKHLAACPQDLSKVKGVGTVYEQKLYAEGIGSYWELANREESALRQILELQEFQKVDVADLQADAQRLAEETKTVGRGWTGAAPDDFELLEGVGATYEGRLYEAGICTFRALADATVGQLAEICKAPAFRVPDYANWIAQAKVILTQRGR